MPTNGKVERAGVLHELFAGRHDFAADLRSVISDVLDLFVHVEDAIFHQLFHALCQSAGPASERT